MTSNQNSWHCLETYLINRGSIPFCLQWISIIFKVNIQLWPFITNISVNLYSIYSYCSKTYHIVSCKTYAFQIHYEPLVREEIGYEIHVQ